VKHRYFFIPAAALAALLAATAAYGQDQPTPEPSPVDLALKTKAVVYLPATDTTAKRAVRFVGDGNGTIENRQITLTFDALDPVNDEVVGSVVITLDNPMDTKRGKYGAKGRAVVTVANVEHTVPLVLKGTVRVVKPRKAAADGDAAAGPHVVVRGTYQGRNKASHGAKPVRLRGQFAGRQVNEIPQADATGL
jgi:hypothetical protein